MIFTQMRNGVDIVPFLKAASAKDFKYIEYSDTNYPSLNERDEDKVRKVKEIAEDCGINIISVHIPPDHDIGSLDKHLREEALQNVKINLANASILGAQYAVLHLSYIEDKVDHDRESIKKYFLESLTELLEEAKRLQITILIENTMGTWCGDIDTIKNIVRRYGNNIGFCLDIGHSLIEKYDPAEVISENIDILKYLHVHDNKGKHDSHLVPGEGLAPWSRIFAALLKTRYSGIFMFESVASLSSRDSSEILSKVKNVLDLDEEKYPGLFNAVEL